MLSKRFSVKLAKSHRILIVKFEAKEYKCWPMLQNFSTNKISIFVWKISKFNKFQE